MTTWKTWLKGLALPGAALAMTVAIQPTALAQEDAKPRKEQAAVGHPYLRYVARKNGRFPVVIRVTTDNRSTADDER